MVRRVVDRVDSHSVDSELLEVGYVSLASRRIREGVDWGTGTSLGIFISISPMYSFILDVLDILTGW